MILKELSYDKLKPVIRIVFEGDKEIFKYYDPNVKIESVDEIVEDIHKKIGTYESPVIYSVVENNKIIGYVVSQENRLISFGLQMQYRIRKYLNEFFSVIKKRLGNDFICLLWARNIRATNWLIKNGMNATYHDNGVVKLHFFKN